MQMARLDGDIKLVIQSLVRDETKRRSLENRVALRFVDALSLCHNDERLKINGLSHIRTMMSI